MKSRASVCASTGATKKRVFLDRPLPGSNPGTREKVAEAGRAALLSRFEVSDVDAVVHGQKRELSVTSTCHRPNLLQTDPPVAERHTISGSYTIDGYSCAARLK